MARVMRNLIASASGLTLYHSQSIFTRIHNWLFLHGEKLRDVDEDSVNRSGLEHSKFP